MKPIIVYSFIFFLFTRQSFCAECTLSKNRLSDADKDKIVAKHNELRNKLASGQQNGQPAAKNIEEMVWDQELGELAQKYANTCPAGHNSNRKTTSYSQTGENLYWSMNSAEQDLDYSQAAQSWYDEVKDFNDKRLIAKFASDSNFHKIGHYTQIIWHDSNKLGCGVNSYKDGTWFKTVVVCNYHKPGNIVGTAIYDEGTAGSGCKTKSTKYTSLCTNSAGTNSSPTATNDGKKTNQRSDNNNDKENKQEVSNNTKDKESKADKKSGSKEGKNNAGSKENSNVNPNIPSPKSEGENISTVEETKSDEVSFLKLIKKKYKLPEGALQSFFNNV